MPDAARLLLPRLLAGGWRDLPFVPIRAGIEIHRIYGDGIAGPAAAVLRYRPGAGVPWHEHEGFEHVVVLEGSQEDERGSYPAGTLAIKPARVAPQRAEPRRLHCAFDLGAAGALHRAGGRGLRRCRRPLHGGGRRLSPSRRSRRPSCAPDGESLHPA